MLRISYVLDPYEANELTVWYVNGNKNNVFNKTTQ